MFAAGRNTKMATRVPRFWRENVLCGLTVRGNGARLPRQQHRLNHSGGNGVPSSQVRQQFLQYFTEQHSHRLVRSSPVVPFNDPSLTFVNAGMNQFKRVLQNLSSPPHRRVANSQKCVRVGGKHNDLDDVGSDGSHLTMFEMLGSWSFGDYWKHEACSLAWNLLTQEYRLDPKRLYVTYFGGCEKSGIPPDIEVKDIWRSLGIPEDHILPFGMKDNFWEMGASGPCGPCTEIHYDHGGTGASMVNKGVSWNVELWNLVFIQYNRSLDESLTPLQSQSVDTGMGLERLTAVLNNSTSNYDTDLFKPIFRGIQKVSKCDPYGGKFGNEAELDTAYRILADHARMITVCLADRVFPEDNHRLRNVIKRAMTVSSNHFNVRTGMLQELSNYVVESLGEAFPELQTNHAAVKLLLDFEEETVQRNAEKNEKYHDKLNADFPSLAKSIDVHESYNFYEALRCLQSEGWAPTRPHNDFVINDRLAYKLYESHGMHPGDIAKLSSVSRCIFDQDAFDAYFSLKKQQSKLTSALRQEEATLGDVNTDLLTADIPETVDVAKYDFVREANGSYQFSCDASEICGIISRGERVTQLTQGEEGVIFLRNTNFYCEAGGQVGDVGSLHKKGNDDAHNGDVAAFKVADTQKMAGTRHLVGHVGCTLSGSLNVGDTVYPKVDTNHRLRCMQNHTATHILNNVLHGLLPVTCQRSSHVGPHEFRFDFAAYNASIARDFVKQIEDRVAKIISDGRQVERRLITSGDLEGERARLITLPGEVYPSDNISIIDIHNTRDEADSAAGLFSEPCCGTHVANTADIQHFVVVGPGVRSPSTGVRSLRAMTGDAARFVRQKGIEVCQDILTYQEIVSRACDELDASDVASIQAKINDWRQTVSDRQFPTVLSLELTEILNTYQQRLRISERSVQRLAAEDQMQVAVTDQKDQPFLVTVLHLPGRSKFSLMKAAKMVASDRVKPCLLLSVTGEDGDVSEPAQSRRKAAGLEVKAKSQVPEGVANSEFNAQTWMRPVLDALNGQGSAPRGQDPRLHFNMKAVKIESIDQIEALKDILINMANVHLKQEEK